MEALTREQAANYRYHLTVRLNGTNENPFHKLGLTQNPFPQNGRAQWDRFELAVNKLGGDPIPDTNYIRRILEGFNAEFVELCCAKFEKGKMVEFTIHFNE